MIPSNSKSSIVSWWILAMMSLFLWYRNQLYDRALAIFVFTLGLIQLIEYGIYSGTDPAQSGRAVFITLWVQCLVLAIGVFVFIHDVRDSASTTQNIIHSIAGLNLFLFSAIFVVALVTSFMNNTFDASPNLDGNIEWRMNQQSIFNTWGWLYMIGIFVPLILILGYYMWADLGMGLLIIYSLACVGYILSTHPIQSTSNLWGYLSVGFAFLAWWIGLFPSSTAAISSI